MKTVMVRNIKVISSILSRNRIRILMYHNVCANPGDRFSVSPQSFAAQMEILASSRVPVLTLEQALEAMKKPASTLRGIVITLDDAYVDLLSNAIPILSQYRFPATIFAVADKTGQHSDWGHSRVSYLTMNWQELARLSSMGFCIGSHTCTHKRLTTLGTNALEFELMVSRQLIQEKIGDQFTSLAYPFGDFGEREEQAARQVGYDCALSAGGLWGNGVETDVYQLKRYLIDSSTGLKAFERTITGINDIVLLLQDRKKLNQGGKGNIQSV